MDNLLENSMEFLEDVEAMMTNSPEDLAFLDSPLDLAFLDDPDLSFDLDPEPPLNYKFHPLLLRKPRPKGKNKPDILFVER